MAKSTKSYEERMLEMEKKEQESLEKAKRYAAQKKEPVSYTHLDVYKRQLFFHPAPVAVQYFPRH